MLARVRAAGAFGPWVIGDEVYGSDPSLNRWPKDQRQPFVLAVRRHERLWISTGATSGRSWPPMWQRLSAETVLRRPAYMTGRLSPWWLRRSPAPRRLRRRREKGDLAHSGWWEYSLCAIGGADSTGAAGSATLAMDLGVG